MGSNLFANKDEILEHLGNYYSSEFVEKQMPWIRKIPFNVWLERQIERMNEQFLRGTRYD